MNAPSSCAICASARGPFAMRPLGRDDALVAVCAACDEEPAKERLGPSLPYEVHDKVSIGDQLDAFAAAANRLTGDTAATNRARRRAFAICSGASPGYVLIRVARRPQPGVSIDAKEARATLKDQPWYREARHVGTDRRYHMFERPDDKAASVARSGADRDPLAGLAQYRKR